MWWLKVWSALLVCWVGSSWVLGTYIEYRRK